MGTIATDLTTDAFVMYTSAAGTYTFSPACNVLKVSHKPIYTQSKRTVSHTLFTIILEDTLQTSDQSDSVKVDTTAIRRALNYPGGDLFVQGVGMGLFAVNAIVLPAAGPIVYDCMWGPSPQELSWENYGNGKAGKITWQVTCAIPEQCDNAASQRSVMAYEYKASFKKDASGYGTRTITGYVEIPITRTAPDNRVPPDNVDRLRESCYPTIGIGWKRTNDTWDVSMDRRRADFSYTDEEQPPNAPAQGVVSCEEDESVESGDNLLSRWTVTLSGTYEMTKARQRAESWNHFTRFCMDRKRVMELATRPDGQLLNCVLIPIKLRLHEPVHSRTSGKFSLVLQYTLSARNFIDAIANAVAASGLWGPLSDSNYTNWQTTMIQDGVFTARGPANTGFRSNAQTDTIIDLCLNSQPATLPGANIFIRARRLGPASIELPAPTLRASFLDYKIGMRVEDHDSVAELKPLPTNEVTLRAGASDIASAAGFLPMYPNTPTSVIQHRSGTSTTVTIYGAALRAGFPVTPPVLTSVAGVPAIRANRPGVNFFQQWVWGNYGVPIFAARWSQRYILPSQPPSYGAPSNPLYDGDGGSASLHT